jgi:hypothetical protein
MSVSITGNDILTINGRVFTDLADGDTSTIDFPNDIMAGKTGKNGNVIIAFNSTGKNAQMTLRLIRASADDKFLNSELRKFMADPAGYVPMTGSFTKRVGNGAGSVSADIYTFKVGIPKKVPGSKENVEGDTEQAVVSWEITFQDGGRAIV